MMCLTDDRCFKSKSYISRDPPTALPRDRSVRVLSIILGLHWSEFGPVARVIRYHRYPKSTKKKLFLRVPGSSDQNTDLDIILPVAEGEKVQ